MSFECPVCQGRGQLEEPTIGVAEDGEVLSVQEESYAKLLNPVNTDNTYARPLIMPGLLKVLQHNSWYKEAPLFEIGKVFPTKDKEVTHLAMACYGDQRTLFQRFLPAKSIYVIRPDHPLAKQYGLKRQFTMGEVALR